MINFIKKQLDINLLNTALVFSLIYHVMFNGAVILHRYAYYEGSGFFAITALLSESAYVYINCFVVFLGLLISRYTFIIGSIFLFLTGAAASYYLSCFKIAPTETVIPAIYGTNTSEIFELVSIRIVIWMMFSLSIALFGIRYFNPNTAKTPLSWIICTICFVVLIINVISPRYRVLKNYFPLQYLHNSYNYFFATNDYEKVDISKNFHFTDKGNEDDIIGVLVIGESSRYTNFGVNGYERDTTPYLSKMDNLISFRAESCGTNTHFSVPCLLSRYNKQDFNLDKALFETGLLSILTRLGYDTSWISTQTLVKLYKNRCSPYDEVNFTMIPGGGLAPYKVSDYDEKMLPYIAGRLEHKGRKFLTIQITGSHWNYVRRYPEKFARFLPTQDARKRFDPTTCTPEERLNSYDNSILYTDFFLASVIDMLKNKNAFLFFVSDHGQSLGEGGRFGHSGDAFEQRDIAFMVWVSDRFKQNNPDLVKAIAKHKEQIISHDYVFHSILDCLKIESEIVNPEYSLCR